MYRIIVLFIVLTFFSESHKLYSQTKRVWINPGIKLGYQFGNANGFLIGFEFSAVWENGDHSKGILIDVDYCEAANFFKLNLSVENHPFPFSKFPLGFSIGPSFILKDSKFYFGLTPITYFMGLGFIPFIGSTFTFDFPPILELGSYIKIPIRVSGPEIKGVGG